MVDRNDIAHPVFVTDWDVKQIRKIRKVLSKCELGQPGNDESLTCSMLGRTVSSGARGSLITMADMSDTEEKQIKDEDLRIWLEDNGRGEKMREIMLLTRGKIRSAISVTPRSWGIVGAEGREKTRRK